MAHYRSTDITVDEFESFLKAPQERFGSCDPFTWWAGCTSQFPNLFCLAKDIFSIPGKLMFFICDFS